MPRFYFNVHDDAEYPDLVGTELPDLNQAREEAIACVGRLLNQEKFWTAKAWSMDVCDDSGLLLFTLAFTVTEMPSARAVSYRAGAA